MIEGMKTSLLKQLLEHYLTECAKLPFGSKKKPKMKIDIDKMEKELDRRGV